MYIVYHISKEAPTKIAKIHPVKIPRTIKRLQNVPIELFYLSPTIPGAIIMHYVPAYPLVKANKIILMTIYASEFKPVHSLSGTFIAL